MPTTADVVLKIMKNIQISKASGVDNLSGIFLKDGAGVLSEPISQICNLSINKGIFPTLANLPK